LLPPGFKLPDPKLEICPLRIGMVEKIGVTAVIGTTGAGKI
jgi:hypothetical protein